MVKKNYMKTATILFYVSPSIETRIKNAKTIDLMEGGKEQAQVVPNSEINPCYNGVEDRVDIDGDGKEGKADGSSGDVPNGAKDRVDIDGDAEEGNAVHTESEINPSYNGVEERVDIYVEAKQTAAVTKMIKRMMKKKKNQVEKSPRGHQTRQVQQIARTPPQIQIPWTPLERAVHE